MAKRMLNARRFMSVHISYRSWLIKNGAKTSKVNDSHDYSDVNEKVRVNRSKMCGIKSNTKTFCRYFQSQMFFLNLDCCFYVDLNSRKY